MSDASQEGEMAWAAAMGDGVFDPEAPRCSCWFHAGLRRGWTDDDPCPVHPEDGPKDES